MKQNLPWADNCWSWIICICIYFYRWFKLSIIYLCEKEYSCDSNYSFKPISLRNCCQTCPWSRDTVLVLIYLHLFWEAQFLQGNSYCFKAFVTKSWFFFIKYSVIESLTSAGGFVYSTLSLRRWRCQRLLQPLPLSEPAVRAQIGKHPSGKNVYSTFLLAKRSFPAWK